MVPTSCGRYWITAVAFETTGPMFAVTIIGKIGGEAVGLDVKVPGKLTSAITVKEPVPVARFQVPEYGAEPDPGPTTRVHVPLGWETIELSPPARVITPWIGPDWARL